MRGEDQRSGSLFSYVDLEVRVPVGHPLRPIRVIVNDVLAALSGEFEALYAHLGRPSIAPSDCCGRCSCRRSIRSGPSAS